jgi:WhiB family transcriptional regulator, redox-sensing transcriptional regulator
MVSVRWKEQAACRDADPDLFFPISAGVRAQADASHARKICRPCPVRSACLQYALVTGQAYGIWGGLTADERRLLSSPFREGA